MKVTTKAKTTTTVKTTKHNHNRQHSGSSRSNKWHAMDLQICNLAYTLRVTQLAWWDAHTCALSLQESCMRTDFARIYILCPFFSAYPNGVHSKQDYYQMLPELPAVHLLVQSSSCSRSCRLSTCLLILLHTPIGKLHFRREACQVTTRCKSSLPCRYLEC